MSGSGGWRSPLLGQARELRVGAARLECHVRGSGPTLVFAHGWLANANLWRKVVDLLADSFECVTLDLPLGSHRLPVSEDVDLSPAGCGALIAGVLAALELDAVTLVGNDSGGAYSQIATAADPQRIEGLVLNSCETPFDEFPPPPFDALPETARDERALGQLLSALRDPEVRRSPAAYGWLIKHPIDELVSDSYALPSVLDRGVLHDIARVMAGTSSEPVHRAGRALIERFTRPVLLAWGREDRVFAIEQARRYAAQLADARVVAIDDAYSFTPEDQPAALARAIARFAAAHDAAVA